MAARHERFCWDERAIRRLLAARADGLTMRQLAARFGCSAVTVERKLAELRDQDAPALEQIGGRQRPLSIAIKPLI